MNVLSKKIGPQGFRARDCFFFFLLFSSLFFSFLLFSFSMHKYKEKCINIKNRTFVFLKEKNEPLSNGEGSWLWSVATSTSGVRRSAVSYRKRKGAGPGKYRSWINKSKKYNLFFFSFISF